MYSAWVDQGKMKPCDVANANVAPASYVLFLNLGHQHMQIFIYAHEQYEIETKIWFYQKELKRLKCHCERFLNLSWWHFNLNQLVLLKSPTDAAPQFL